MQSGSAASIRPSPSLSCVSSQISSGVLDRYARSQVSFNGPPELRPPNRASACAPRIAVKPANVRPPGPSPTSSSAPGVGQLARVRVVGGRRVAAAVGDHPPPPRIERQAASLARGHRFRHGLFHCSDARVSATQADEHPSWLVKPASSHCSPSSSTPSPHAGRHEPRSQRASRPSAWQRSPSTSAPHAVACSGVMQRE